ncbi:uncharacterized protein LOC113560203 [Rhopalosiphum maidis]|uniref:uncharacterized protein LOC113560203 n=1 Tax=Rhopalosiphum maidis TaxID=43146 RepID=UPI000EFF1FEF|nr:uncharacterized protein LOC113560203 [Rhopalosiphum maidis]
MASMTTLFLLLAVTYRIQAIYDVPGTFPQTKPEQELPDTQVIVDRIKDSCPPFGSPDEQFKVMVLGSLNPPVGGCASMRADIGDNVPAFEMLLGDIDYSVKGHQKVVLLKNRRSYTFQCSSKHPFIENGNIEGWYVQLYIQSTKKNDYRCSLYKILNELGTIKVLISADEWCDGLPQMLSYDGYGVPNGYSTNGSLALIFAKHWVPNPFPEFLEYDLLSDMCALG